MRFFNQNPFKTLVNIACADFHVARPASSAAKISQSLAALLLIAAFPASAQLKADANRWWITPGAVSYHFKNQDQFNQTHPGLGVEYHFQPDWAVVAGTYKNSNSLWSKYLGVNWTPLRLGAARLGATAQIADNYKAARNGKPFAFAAPLIAFEGEHLGANIYIIPTIRNVTGAVALQFKFSL